MNIFKFVFSNRTPDEPDPLVTERDRLYPDIDELPITSDGDYQNYSKISIQINLWDLIKFIRGCSNSMPQLLS